MRKVNAEMQRVIVTSERFRYEIELWLKLACVMSAAFGLGVAFLIMVERVYSVSLVGAFVMFFIFARVLLWVVERVCCFPIAIEKAQDRSRLFASSE